MWVITYKGKPTTLEKLYSLDGDYLHDHYKDYQYIAAPTKAAAIDMFIFYRGFTWKERFKGVECQKVSVK